MLGHYGETLVVDWGLAKPLGAGPAGQIDGGGTLQPVAASGSVPTLMGPAVARRRS